MIARFQVDSEPAAAAETAQAGGPRWPERRRLVEALAGSADLATDQAHERAQAVTELAIREYARCLSLPTSLAAPGRVTALPFDVRRAVRDSVAALAPLPQGEAMHHLAALYTSLLPAQVRAARGAYYTPPLLAERLLDLAAAEGVDWANATVLDPACGGGAFLVPVVRRVLADDRIRSLSPEDQLRHLEGHLHGIEIDPFAAWMSETFLGWALAPVCQLAGRPAGVRIERTDALSRVLVDPRRFDLVVGNPPYGRVSLDPERRRAFTRSLFGHANLYGLFLDAALRWRRPRGLVAFLTPASFLGGQYFSRLRSLLLAEAPPLVVGVVEARQGVFEDVLQETCLAVFGPNPGGVATAHLLRISAGVIEARRSGVFSVAGRRGEPWLLARSPEQARWIDGAARLRTRLHHLGYKASTGPLVWNREKDRLRRRPGTSTFPLIWAEAVRAEGFRFAYRARAHAPFFRIDPEVDGEQGHLLLREPSVLVQRTTAKEQGRRLVACTIPEEFLAEWRCCVVENHVNVLRPTGSVLVAPAVLAAVLNTRVVDEVFRSLSGTVAVSAAELHALPLPSPETFRQVGDRLARCDAADDPRVRNEIENLVARDYGHS